MTAEEHLTAGGHRAQFDFEVDFSNGGGIQGQGFRLDIAGDDISDEELAACIIRDMRLLMVGEVRILHKQIIREAHKRSGATPQAGQAGGRTRIDLSHVVKDRMVTYPGLPAPAICDFLSREQSRARYAPGTEFQIGMIELCANTGTYLDSPFHRYPDGTDLAGLPLERLAELDAVVVDVSGQAGRPVDRGQLLPYDVGAKAVLVRTGWDRHWGTDAYFRGHPFLTAAAAEHLAAEGAALAGIDSLNIDDTSSGERPVHSTLLAAGIPICEHLTNLAALPAGGFRFSAVPVKIRGMGTFPVRAYATIQAGGHG
ncbi:MAG TPA: cyclase [Actinobacteria bacterium]|nr:cyclase [Actinomycetota bacterium]